MNAEEFDRILAYPLDLKIQKTKLRIHEAVRRFGLRNVYISYSGGKDSSVLLDIARSDYPDIKAVYCDTGLEYPEVKAFVKKTNNLEIIKPKQTFKQVVTKYGYPIISKEQAHYIYDLRNSKSQKTINIRLNGDANGNFKLSKKWRFLLDAPFKISHLCCRFMKKQPLQSFVGQRDVVSILGTRATESRLRRTDYIHNGGCNSFDSKHPKSQPLSFWTEQDILQYIKQKKIKIPPVYGEIIEDKKQISFFDNNPPKLKCSGVSRTGCIFCGFGCHIEESPNRFQRLKKTHPKLYEYVIGGGENANGWWQPSASGLGFWKVLDFINVNY